MDQEQLEKTKNELIEQVKNELKNEWSDKNLDSQSQMNKNIHIPGLWILSFWFIVLSILVLGLYNSHSNSVPIGFIYVQLWGQSEPMSLWPNTEWENISPKYAGLFFRAEGGQSSSFGQTQYQQSLRLSLYSHPINTTKQNYYYTSWSYIDEHDKYCFTGSDTGTNQLGLKMKFNYQEIRPRNQAVRIWQRIK